MVNPNLTHEQQSADSERKEEKGFMLLSWELSAAIHTKSHAFLGKPQPERQVPSCTCVVVRCVKGPGASHQGLRVLLELLQML